jgi:hypothetical protein
MTLGVGAASYWPAFSPDEIEWELGNMRVRHRETGQLHRIELGWPVGGETQSSVQGFCVRDGRMILLSIPGTERPTTHGQVHSYRIENTWAAPAERAIL